jgi:N,N'-diacetyllegionaminate synthase
MKSYIVAEIGLNHCGSMQLARKTIEAAKEAGADAVKFQNYKTESFIGQRSTWWTYRDGTKERQYEMFKRHELTFADLVQIDAWCRELHIDWHSTPMCEVGLRELVKLKVKVLKNGSDCLQDLKLIRAMGMTKIPLVISTGMAQAFEIELAVDAAKSAKVKDLTLLHCTSAYPAADSDMNICRVKTLRDTYQVKTGLSDHSEGTAAAVLSTAYGATWIEKHFTLNKTMPGPDHWFSADIPEMKQLVRDVRRAEAMIGTPQLGMTATEKKNRKEWFRA